MGGYCNFFKCFCDDYEQIEKEREETGEYIDLTTPEKLYNYLIKERSFNEY